MKMNQFVIRQASILGEIEIERRIIGANPVSELSEQEAL
jgi:hypothetical protein